MFRYRNRFYVHVDIVDKFLDYVVEYARNLIVGDPLKLNTQMGPVVSKQHYDKIKSYIELAKKSGHRILCGETVE